MKKDAGTKRVFRAAAWGVALLLLMAGVAFGQSAIAQPNIIKHTPNMRMADLAGRPDTDRVQYSDGRSVTVGDLRKLAVVQKRMMAAKPGSKRSPLLNAHPDASNIKMQIRSGFDLGEALKRPNDGDTVQLPSKRLVTVGQLKFLREGEKRLGRTFIPVSERPGISGPFTAVSSSTTKDEWKVILQKSNDKTVLKSQNGTRVTVGELKQELAKIFKAEGAPPQKAAPTGGVKMIAPDKTKLPSIGGAK
jgi:hypothetical protein